MRFLMRSDPSGSGFGHRHPFVLTAGLDTRADFAAVDAQRGARDAGSERTVDKRNQLRNLLGCFETLEQRTGPKVREELLLEFRERFAAAQFRDEIVDASGTRRPWQHRLPTSSTNPAQPSHAPVITSICGQSREEAPQSSRPLSPATVAPKLA